MPEDFQLSLKNAGSLMMTPQEGLKSFDSDYSSLFGDYDLQKDLKDIPIHSAEENLNTPFTYDKVTGNIFDIKVQAECEEAETDSYDDYEDWDTPGSSLTFEC